MQNYNSKFKIDLNKALTYKDKALNYLSKAFKNFTFEFDHFGIIATKEDYERLKKEISKKGKVYHEFLRSGKRWFTSRLDNVTYEVFGPVSNECIEKTYLNHASFMVNNDELDKISKQVEGSIITSFHVKNSRGIKIEPKRGLIIEIRNNDIIDSIEDFK